MSSTIFTATSGTSISVDPHADVEDAGQQNPAVPHDAQNGAPAPGNPPNEDLVQAEARLRQMLDTALAGCGASAGICTTPSKPKSPDPKSSTAASASTPPC